ncbi:type I glyceraldehyde-3-phosphate dehydrogenase [Allisonella histaminiformans]|uniref:type I glyceraldehyde-3-phosphate dehydrogenase n=1 Tax=Allisonella histaminiformans TaxID=209880 RepID=UPI002943BDBD|nr:type I glyceraldehyde-3-phosphate dehydrogenase [Allisonella histaminiformans]
MTKTKVGINGFGRIGRLVFRGMLESDDLEVVAINNPSGAANAAYLLKYDTVHGRLDREVIVDGDTLIVDGRRVAVLHDRDPENLDWSSYGVEIVVESTGKLKDKASASKHIRGTVKKVIITAPGKDEDATIVMGVNEEIYDPANHSVISNASCTTNCLAPVVKVLNNTFGIRRGLMTTVHSYTNDQAILDKNHKKDARRGRAGAENIIPTSTGAAKAIGLVIPSMKGKLNGLSIRVPTPDVSLVDLVCELNVDEVTKEEINAALKSASENEMKGILGYTDEPLVSSDFRGTNESSTVDSSLTMVMNKNLVKVIAWYDNEWGYSERTIDLVAYVASKGL